MTACDVSASPGTELDRALDACRGPLALVFLYTCGHNILLLAPFFYLLQIYDRVLASGSLDTLLMLTLIVAAAVVVDSVLDVVRRAILARLGLWIERRLQGEVVTSALEFARNGNPAVAAEASRDLAAIRQFIGSPSAAALFDLPWTAVFFVLLFAVDPLLGAVGAGGAFLMLACAIANQQLTKGPLARAQAAETSTHQRLGATIGSVQTIRAMGMLDGAARLVFREAETASAAQATALRRGETFQAVSRCTRSLVQILVMGAAAWLVLQEHLSAGIIFASSLLLSRGLSPLENVIASFKAFGGARLAYRRLGGLLAAAPPRPSGAIVARIKPEGCLGVDNVTFVAPGTNTIALRSVSLNVAVGECVGIIGPSGAGKSTLAKLMVGVSAPTMGRVRLDGADVQLWHSCGGSKYIGYLSQEVELFEGTIADNIARLGRVDARAVVEAAKLAGLHETVMALPLGYETEIGERGARLSGGQRQLVGLARALYGEPRLVVLDEPNAHLDDAGEQLLHGAIAALRARSITVVIITHRPGILDHTDRIAILRGGVVVACDTRENIYRQYLEPKSRIPGAAPPSATTPAAADVKAMDPPPGRDRAGAPRLEVQS